jgi:hypothetical protein
MLSLAGCITAIFPYVEKISLGPIERTDDDQCKRTLTITSMGCTLELVLFGPTPETLAFEN